MSSRRKPLVESVPGILPKSIWICARHSKKSASCGYDEARAMGWLEPGALPVFEPGEFRLIEGSIDPFRQEAHHDSKAL